MTTRHGTNPDPPSGSKPAPPANPSDRNSEGAFTERHGVDLRGIRVGEVLTQDQWDAVCAFVIEQDRIIDGTAAEVQALVERWEKDIAEAGPFNKKDLRPARFVRELAKLARNHAPEVSSKPPIPEEPRMMDARAVNRMLVAELLQRHEQIVRDAEIVLSLRREQLTAAEQRLANARDSQAEVKRFIMENANE